MYHIDLRSAGGDPNFPAPFVSENVPSPSSPLDPVRDPQVVCVSASILPLSTEAESSGGLRAPALSAPPPEALPGARTRCPPAGTGAAVLSGGLRAPAAAGAQSVPLPPPRAVLGTRGCTPRMLAQRDPLIKRPRASSSPHASSPREGSLVPGQLFQGLSAELSFCWGLSSHLMTAPRLGVTGPGSSVPDLQKFPSGNGSPANLTPEPDSPARGGRPRARG